MRAVRSAPATRAASHHSSISFQAIGSSSSIPDTTRKWTPERAKAFAISGTQQVEQLASHSPVSVFS